MTYIISFITALAALIGSLLMGEWWAAVWVIVAALWMWSSYNQQLVINILKERNL